MILERELCVSSSYRADNVSYYRELEHNTSGFLSSLRRTRHVDPTKEQKVVDFPTLSSTIVIVFCLPLPT